jgi:hypothetical protein
MVRHLKGNKNGNGVATDRQHFGPAPGKALINRPLTAENKSGAPLF